MHFLEIKNESDFSNWLRNTSYEKCFNEIQPIIAKANQHPTIDAMRFEAAKDLSIGMLQDPNFIAQDRVMKDLGLPNDTEYKFEYYVRYCVKYGAIAADALIAELQKTKP